MDRMDLEPNNRKLSHTLGKLSIALLENLVEPVIGQDAIDLLKNPVIEKELNTRLSEVLATCEKSFVQNFENFHLSNALINSSFENKDALRKAVRAFFHNPANTELRSLLNKQIQQHLPFSDVQEIDGAVCQYLKLLHRDLLPLSSAFREKTTALAQLNILDELKKANDYEEQNANHLNDIKKILLNQAQVEKPAPPPVPPLFETHPQKKKHSYVIPGGALDPNSPFYIERSSDEDFFTCFPENASMASAITIKAPRQMGKSSLLNRALVKASQLEMNTVRLDFQDIAAGDFKDSLSFTQEFCRMLVAELGMDVDVQSHWDTHITTNYACKNFLEKHVLSDIPQSLMLGIDELDRIIHFPFYKEFFTLLRSLNQEHSYKQQWKKLSMIYVISTEPYLLIRGNQSPFNNTPIINLEDFTLPEIQRLNRLYQEPFSAEGLQQLVSWVGGQVNLVHWAIYWAANGLSLKDMILKSLEGHGPFTEHLEWRLSRLDSQPDLKNAMQKVMKGINPRLREQDWLKSVGLVRVDENGIVRPRYRLYHEYLRRRLE
jgi:hypothetical protein